VDDAARSQDDRAASQRRRVDKDDVATTGAQPDRCA
jgi:hypothetical protein